jgi:hypothetical protein
MKFVVNAKKYPEGFVYEGGAETKDRLLVGAKYDSEQFPDLIVKGWLKDGWIEAVK